MKVRKISLLIACLMVLLSAGVVTSCKPDVDDNTTVVTNDDGSVTTTVTNEDGSSVATTEYTDGSKKVEEKFIDGTSKTTYTFVDGTETVTEADGKGNSSSVTKKTDGTVITEEKNADGSSSMVTTFKNGDTTVSNTTALGETTTVESKTGADGIVTVTTITPDEKVTSVYTDANGTKVTTEKFKNGNETVTTVDASGASIKTEKKTDGTTIVTTTETSGKTTKVTTDKDGKVTKEVTVINSDGSKTITKIDENGNETTETKHNNESEHMVLTNTDDGILITVSKLPKNIVDVSKNEVHVSGLDIFAYLDSYAVTSGADKIECLYPYVKSNKTYTINLVLEYTDNTGKKGSINESASILANVKNPQEYPVDLEKLKKINFSAEFDYETGRFVTKNTSELTDFNDIIKQENIYGNIYNNLVIGDRKYYNYYYSDNNFNGILSSSPIYTGYISSKLKENGNKFFAYGCFEYYISYDNENYQGYGYNYPTESVKTITPLLKNSKITGSWIENSEAENKSSLSIDEYGWTTIYFADENKKYYGYTTYTSDSEITLRLQYYQSGSYISSISEQVTTLTFADDVISCTDNGKTFVKTTAGNSNNYVEIGVSSSDVSITTRKSNGNLYLAIETEGYSFDRLEIDGMQVSYYYSSDKEKYFYMSNYSQGTHILTVYYYQSDNSSFKFSKTITIEIE